MSMAQPLTMREADVNVDLHVVFQRHLEIDRTIKHSQYSTLTHFPTCLYGSQTVSCVFEEINYRGYEPCCWIWEQNEHEMLKKSG